MVLLTATNCCLSGGGIANAQDNLITKTLVNYSQQAIKENLKPAVWATNRFQRNTNKGIEIKIIR